MFQHLTREHQINGSIGKRKLVGVLDGRAALVLDDALACRRAGMDDVLAKPIVPAELIGKLMQWGSAVAEPTDAVAASA